MKQKQRHRQVAVKVDHPDAASFANAVPPPAHLADAARVRDHIAHLRVARNEINEFRPLSVGPDIGGLPQELRQLDDRERDARQRTRICQWRLFASNNRDAIGAQSDAVNGAVRR
jgi:hypothetical protein